MSALVNSLFTYRTPSWHRLENDIFDEYPGREVAFAASGQDFTLVETRVGDEGSIISNPETYVGPMCRVERLTAEGKATGLYEWRSYRRSAKEKGLVISQLRDGVPGPLHGKTIKHVNKSYEPIPNEVPWDILDMILSDETLNRTMKINYETGGVLEDGASCFVTARLDFPFMIPGDNSAVYPYLFATWRHDAAGALNLGGTDVRMVCANTRGMAEAQATKMGRMFSFKHTKNYKLKIEDAVKVLKGIVIEHNEFEALANELAAITLTDEQRTEIVQKFVPYPSSTVDAELQVSERVRGNVQRARAAVFATFNSPTIPEAHAFTGWGVYNAMTEYLDHFRPSRGGSAIEGNPTSYVKRQLLDPTRAKQVIVPLIKEVALVA